MAISEDKTIWIDGVPYIQDYSVMPPRIMLHPDYHPTIWFRIKHLYWGLLCKIDDLKIRLHNMINTYILVHSNNIINSDKVTFFNNKDTKALTTIHNRSKIQFVFTNSYHNIAYLSS